MKYETGLRVYLKPNKKEEGGLARLMCKILPVKSQILWPQGGGVKNSEQNFVDVLYEWPHIIGPWTAFINS